MFIKTYSYRFAEEILQHTKYKSIYEELIKISKECPVPLYKGKSKNQANKDVIQQLMNTFFRLRFFQYGWEKEPFATPDYNEDALRSDFRKEFYDTETGEYLATVQIEVEFGNVASSYRNYFKFQLSFSYNMTDICILIVPSHKLSNRIDSGVSNYEKTIREIPSAKLSITVPTLVIGLFDRNDDGMIVDEWNVKAITTNLNLLKGSKSEYIEEHNEIVMKYINTL